MTWVYLLYKVCIYLYGIRIVFVYIHTYPLAFAVSCVRLKTDSLKCLRGKWTALWMLLLPLLLLVYAAVTVVAVVVVACQRTKVGAVHLICTWMANGKINCTITAYNSSNNNNKGDYKDQIQMANSFNLPLCYFSCGHFCCCLSLVKYQSEPSLLPLPLSQSLFCL